MSTSELRREETAPFLVKLFYRTGAFHRPDEFNMQSLPPHLTMHTWKDCSLLELCYHLVEASPRILPDPAVGTRVALRLIYADSRARMDLPPRYVARDLGSVVLGGGGPGAGPDEGVAEDDAKSDDDKTLADVRFMPGDYISCAILPPNELTGDVTPASSARVGRGAGVGEARSAMGSAPLPPPPLPPLSRPRDFGSQGGPRGRGFRGSDFRGYGRYHDWDAPFSRGGGGIPEGEWRRGERLPDVPLEPGRLRR